MTTTNGSTTYTHDKFGRVTASTQTTLGTPYPFAYAYTLSDQLTAMAYPSGRIVNYGLDGADRLTSVTGSWAGAAAAYASGISYTAPGTLSALTPGSGIAETYSWNDRLQPTAINAGNLLTPNLYPCDGGATSCATGNNGRVWRENITVGGILKNLPAAKRFLEYLVVSPAYRAAGIRRAVKFIWPARLRAFL